MGTVEIFESEKPDRSKPRSAPGDVAHYKSAVFYFRRDLRAADSLVTAQSIGLAVCGELEKLKDWVREQGMTPPKWLCSLDECRDKGWAPYERADGWKQPDDEDW